MYLTGAAIGKDTLKYTVVMSELVTVFERKHVSGMESSRNFSKKKKCTRDTGSHGVTTITLKEKKPVDKYPAA